MNTRKESKLNFLFTTSIFGLFALVFSHASMATLITYAVQNVGGNTWQYNYQVENNTLNVAIEEFSIYFDVGLYQNLTLATAPSGWDPLLIQPDPLLPDAGFYDALALISGIAPLDSLSGFGVQFDFLGVGTPGPQTFEILDPLTFLVLDSGLTQVAGNGTVAEPLTGWLLLAGLLGIAWFNRPICKNFRYRCSSKKLASL